MIPHYLNLTHNLLLVYPFFHDIGLVHPSGRGPYVRHIGIIGEFGETYLDQTYLKVDDELDELQKVHLIQEL